MKRGYLGVLTLGLALVADGSVSAQPRGRADPDAAKNGWLIDLDAGITEVEKSGKPLMVVFRCVP
jgi:hypothetical protein